MRRGAIAAGLALAASLAVPVAPATSAPMQATGQTGAVETKAVVPTPRKAVKYRAPLAGGKKYKANGKQECARRVRQIAAGQITAANGLAA